MKKRLPSPVSTSTAKTTRPASGPYDQTVWDDGDVNLLGLKRTSHKTVKV